jgi:hypothetical protein
VPTRPGGEHLQRERDGRVTRWIAETSLLGPADTDAVETGSRPTPAATNTAPSEPIYMTGHRVAWSASGRSSRALKTRSSRGKTVPRRAVAADQISNLVATAIVNRVLDSFTHGSAGLIRCLRR